MVFQAIDGHGIAHIVLLTSLHRIVIMAQYLFHLHILQMILFPMQNQLKSMSMLENDHYYLLNQIFKTQ